MIVRKRIDKDVQFNIRTSLGEGGDEKAILEPDNKLRRRSLYV